jgi:hypothetical protein
MLRNEEIATLLKEPARDDSVVYVLFLEPRHTADPSWSKLEKCIDFAVKRFQPEPALTHCELLLLPESDGDTKPLQFATYLGKKSAWQTDRVEGFFYYLAENGGRWRAVPVFGREAGQRVREIADLEVGAAYSLSRYLTSVWPSRIFARFMSSENGAPAHCATLVARVLRGAIGLRHVAAFYGPSSLYNELSASSQLPQTAPAKTPESAEALLRSPATFDAIREIGDENCKLAISELTNAVRTAADPRNLQKQLATALLRYVLLRKVEDSPAHQELMLMTEV